MQSPEYIRLRVRDPGKNGTVAVWIANSYLEKIFIKQIVPEPNSTIAGQGRTVFVFSTPITNSEVFVKFNLDPEKPGRLSGLIGTGAGSELAFAQFVYP